MSVYKEFDAKANSFTARPGDISRCVGDLMDLISYLPQSRAQLIPEKRARNWARKTLNTELLRSIRNRNENFSAPNLEEHATEADLDTAWRQAVWHVRRASGIGGSEIGEVVLHLRDGKRGDFGDARSVAMSKLLIFSPLEGDEAMDRGHRMEKFIRETHHESEGSKTCEAGMRAVKGKRSEKHPFLTGNPDDLTLIERNGSTFRFADDYKCPSPDVFKAYEKDGPTYSQICQLHQYDLLCDEFGVKLSAMRLVPFKFASARTVPMIVKRDLELRADIEKYAGIFWNEFVMLGRIPDPIETKQMEIEDPRIREEMAGMAALKGILKGAEEKFEESREKVFSLISEIDDHATGALSIGFSSVTRKITYDTDKLIEIAEAHTEEEIDLSDLVKPTQKPDTEKVKDLVRDIKKLEPEDLAKFKKKLSFASLCQKVADPNAIAERLISMGISVTAAMKTEDSFEMTRKQSGLEYDTKENLFSTSREIISEIYDDVMADPEKFLEKIRGLDDPDVPQDDMSAMPEM